MMTGDETVVPTFGISLDGEGGNYYPTELWPKSGGLTKRELFAAMCLQGMLGEEGGPGCNPVTQVKAAVLYADALLAALEEKPEVAR